jgi:hypothetical protein
MNAPLQAVVVARPSDLGEGFVVRRALPSAALRNVGPFVFLDDFGPVDFAPGQGLDVRPHPHIGLATVTYLFEGEILHRDSLGSVVPIRPGAVNWMTAGGGIVHSERTPPGQRGGGARLAGLQLWVALPREHEEAAPAFAHHAADELPELERDGVRLRVIVGTAFGATSPVAVLSPMFYVDVALAASARLAVPDEHAERAAYVVQGAVRLGDALHGPGRLLVLAPGAPAELVAEDGPARLVLVGGAPLDAPRFVWWNFVSSSRERIERAREDWAAQRFAAVPGESEFIPLPAGRPFPQPL